jgi:hypothetical protein
MEPKPGMRYRVRARPLEGLAGRFSLPLGPHGISTRTVLKTRRTSLCPGLIWGWPFGPKDECQLLRSFDRF